MGFPGGSDSKESAHNVGDHGSVPGSVPGSGRYLKKGMATYLPGEFHGQRSLDELGTTG